MQPAAGSTTTTTTEIWQWQCAGCRTGWKMLRQVTTRCPHGHGCRCCHGQGTPPPPAGNHPLPPPPPHHHHHHHHHGHQHHLPQQKLQGTSWALAAEADQGSKSNKAGRETTTALRPAPPAVAQIGWVPDPYLMVQQLREFEPLNDEVVALRVQLQEYAEEIEGSIRMRGDDGAGTDWFIALPASVRDVLVMARDAIESFVAMSTAAAPAKLLL